MCELFKRFQVSLVSKESFDSVIANHRLYDSKSVVCRPVHHCVGICEPAFNWIVQSAGISNGLSFFLHTIKHLLDSGFDPLEADKFGVDSILCAMRNGKFEIARLILKELGMTNASESLAYFKARLTTIQFDCKLETELGLFLHSFGFSLTDLDELMRLCRFETIIQVDWEKVEFPEDESIVASNLAQTEPIGISTPSSQENSNPMQKEATFPSNPIEEEAMIVPPSQVEKNDVSIVESTRKKRPIETAVIVDAKRLCPQKNVQKSDRDSKFQPYKRSFDVIIEAIFSTFSTATKYADIHQRLTVILFLLRNAKNNQIDLKLFYEYWALCCEKMTDTHDTLRRFCQTIIDALLKIDKGIFKELPNKAGWSLEQHVAEKKLISWRQLRTVIPFVVEELEQKHCH